MIIGRLPDATPERPNESPRLETLRGFERVRSLRSLLVSRVGIYSTAGLDGIREDVESVEARARGRVLSVAAR